MRAIHVLSSQVGSPWASSERVGLGWVPRQLRQRDQPGEGLPDSVAGSGDSVESWTLGSDLEM